MDYGQIDIGFATDVKNWFLQELTKTRWFKQVLHIKGEMKVENVTFDTYMWADQNNKQISHGRFRCYENNTEISGDVKGMTANNVLVKGTNPKLKFTHFKTKYSIWYDVKNMEWNILLDGTKYVTKDFKGNITGIFTKDPIAFVCEDETDIYYSGMVTLIDADLNTFS